MRSWEYDFICTGAGRPDKLSDLVLTPAFEFGVPLGRRHLLPILKQGIETYPFEQLVTAPFELGTKISPYSCRRLVVHFGGFFSFKSKNPNNTRDSYFSGVSFFSVIGRRGWVFVTRNNFPLDAKSLNRRAVTNSFLARNPTPIGVLHSAALFDRSPVCVVSQLNNFSPHYKGRLRQLISPMKEGRDAKAFKVFHQQTEMEAFILRREDTTSNSVAPTTIVLDKPEFEFSSALSAWCRPRRLDCSGIDQLSYTLEKYSDFAKNINAAVVSSATAELFSKRLWGFLKASSVGHAYNSKSFMMFRAFFVAYSRRYLLTTRRRNFDAPSWAFCAAIAYEKDRNNNDSSRKVGRKKKFRYRAIYRNYVTFLHSSRLLAASELSHSYFSQALGDSLLRKRGKWRPRRSRAGRFSKRTRWKYNSSGAVKFLGARAKLIASDDQLGLAGPDLAALTHFKAVRKKFISRKRRKLFRVNRAAVWMNPKRKLVGRRGRRRALMRR